jgi:nitroreductase
MKKFNIYQLISVLLVITVFVLATQIGNSPKETMNNTLSVIHSRKSVRHFTAQSVSKDDLQILVKAGMAAPSGKNEQPWAFVVVTQRTALDTLAERLPYAKMLTQAQAAIVVCGDMRKPKDATGGLWIQDCSAATQNILLAAEAMGLGAVWTAAYPYEERIAAVTQTLRFPEYIIPLCVIPIGYPDGSDKPKDKWKEENLKWETWQ